MQIDDEEISRCSEVVWLDATLWPVEDERHAVFAKIVYEDGTVQLLELE